MAANDPTAYGASWYAANQVEAPERAPLGLELDVDVCVVGAGLAGLTVALEVARRGWSVAVLETRRVAWNASGGNAGLVLPGFAAGAGALTEKVGPDHAKALWGLSQQGAEYVRSTVRETGMAGVDLEEGGCLQVSRTGDDDALRRHADLLAGNFGVDAQFWSAERVYAQLHSPRYFGGVYFPKGFAINPLNYALGLAAAAEDAGARIFEGTPALQIDPAGVRKRISTPSARLRAGHVVLAGNVHIGGLMPQLADTLVPISNIVVTSAPLGEALRDAIAFRGTVSDGVLADCHHRIVGGDRLMWCGHGTVWPSKPRRHVQSLAREISRTYPQLGELKIEYAWSGTTGTTVHRMPQIGELVPGVWLASGFGPHGINTTAMAGNIVARAIVDGARTWEAFQPFDLVWAGGWLGRAAVQAHAWSSRAAENAKAWLAQRRKPQAVPPSGSASSGEQGTKPDADQGTQQDETPAAPTKQPKRRRRRSKDQVEPVAEPVRVNDPGSS